MYTLDTKSAREAENIGSYLSETGKYKGKFIRAEKLISSAKSTHGIGFTFESDGGQTTKFDIWTMNAQNEHLGGFKAVNAIMACMKLRGLSVGRGEVEKYDYATQQRYKEEADIFPELLGKPIGLVLQNTEYEKQKDRQKTGEYGWRLELVAPFEAATEFTAAEILDKATQPKKLASILSTLADRPIKNKAGGRPIQAQSENPGHGMNQSRAESGFNEPDEIPF